MLDKEHRIENEEALNGVAGGLRFITHDPLTTKAAAAGITLADASAQESDTILQDTAADLSSDPAMVARRRPR